MAQFQNIAMKQHVQLCVEVRDTNTCGQMEKGETIFRSILLIQ